MIRWASFLVLVWLGVASLACAPSEPEPKRPNILVIVLDTFRVDRLGQGLTPNIDALSGQSTVFDRAVTTIATTLPAHASMFTGLAPNRHGVRWNGDQLSSANVTAAELLHDAGYETAAFVTNTRLLTRGGFHQGFSTLSDQPFSQSAPMRRSGDEITEMAKNWICNERTQPFFAWVHYFGTHSPYRMTEIAAKRLNGYNGILAEGATARILIENREEITGSPEDLRVLRALYDGTVTEVDGQIGRLIEECRNTGALDNTIVILTSDHGQILGEHGDLLHGGHLWDLALRIPLIIRHPKANPGLVVQQRVGIADIAPTLLDLAGLNIPTGLQGISLVPAIFGRPTEPRVYISEARKGANADSKDSRMELALYEGNVKVVRKLTGVQVYDLANDAGENKPVPADWNPTLRGRVHKLMEAYDQIESGERSVKLEELDKASIQELRALGYIE